MNKKILAFVAIIAIVSAGMCGVYVNQQGLSTTQKTRTITDMLTRSVNIPKYVTRIVTLYPPATAVVYAVDGSADRLVGIDKYSIANKGFEKIDPNINKKVNIGLQWTGVNKEEVLLLNPDVIIAGGRSRTKLEDIGIPTIYINTNNFDDVRNSLPLIGEVLQKSDRANDLVAYIDQKRSDIIDETSQIPDKKKVYMACFKPLQTFSGNTFQDELIGFSGGINVARNITADFRPEISIEQVMMWNPDVIILDPYCSVSPKNLLNDVIWQQINAAQNGKVFRMPEFIGCWNTPVPESILGVGWLANELYPDKMNLNMTQEVKDFYRTFYNYTMPDEEIDLILSGELMH